MFMFDRQRAVYWFFFSLLLGGLLKLLVLFVVAAGLTTMTPVKTVFEFVTTFLYLGAGGTYFLRRQQ